MGSCCTCHRFLCTQATNTPETTRGGKKNRDKLLEKEKKPYTALRAARGRKKAGNVAHDSPQPGAGLCSSKRVKMQRGGRRGGGRGGGRIGKK